MRQDFCASMEPWSGWLFAEDIEKHARRLSFPSYFLSNFTNVKVNQAKRPVYTGEARSILPIHDGSMGSRDRYRAEQGYFLIFVLHAWMHGRNGAIKSRRFAFVSRMLFEKINNTSPDGTIGFLFFLFFFISPPPHDHSCVCLEFFGKEKVFLFFFFWLTGKRLVIDKKKKIIV